MAEPKQSDQEGLDRLMAQAWARLSGAVLDVAQDVASQGSQRAPIDTGVLRASIYAETAFKIDEMKKQVTVNVVARTPYAFIQHENEDFNHPRGGEAKYLTRPFQERASRYRESVRLALREALQMASGGGL